MQSLLVVLLYELFELFPDARPAAHPRVMEAVNAIFQGVIPPFSEVSVGIGDPTAPSYS